MDSYIEISPSGLKKHMENGEEILLIDVREKFERNIAHIENSIHIPLGKLHEKLNSLDKSDFIVLHCHHGLRSMFAANVMKKSGFSRVFSLAGGIDEWAATIDKNLPRY